MQKDTHVSVGRQIHQALSEKLSFKTILAVLVFGAIILSFVLSGVMGTKSGSLGMGVAATVNGEIISVKQYQDQENRISAYYSQMLGGQFENVIQRKQLQTEALKQLVDNSVVSQAAQKEKIFASDANVRAMIHEMPYFKKEGVFQIDLYKGLLAQNGLTPGDFEKSLRQQIAIQKVRDLFEASSFVTALEKDVDAQLKNSKMNLEYLKIGPELFVAPQSISDAEVASSLQKPEFMTRVRAYHTANESKFGSPEQVNAAHILIKADEKNAEESKKAEVKARAILKEAQTQDFGKVAAKYSEDPGSKDKKGALGFFARNSMIKEFEDVAFSLPVGQVSGVVKTAFGYHIIKVLEKKPAVRKDEKESNAVIARTLLSEEKTLALAKKAEEFLAKNPARAEVEAFAKANQMKLKETGYFEISGETVPGIGSAAVFKTALGLTKDKPVSNLLVKEGDSQYVVVLKDTNYTPLDQGAKPGQAQLSSQNEMMEKQKSYAQYQYWLENYKKSFSISSNSDLFIK